MFHATVFCIRHPPTDLSFDRHVSIVSASSFYWLGLRLQRSRRSLDIESASTLVHSFVASRIDYCNAVLAGAPKASTNKLQRILNAAARVVSGTQKFDRGLSRLLHTELHWLDVPERVENKFGVMVFNCVKLLRTYLSPPSVVRRSWGIKQALYKFISPNTW